MAIFCSILKHVPDRSRVWDDGRDFRAPCRRCGTAMIRDVYLGWRRFDPGRDHAHGEVRHSRPSQC